LSPDLAELDVEMARDAEEDADVEVLLVFFTLLCDKIVTNAGIKKERVLVLKL
jgi:hypothetical protein